MAFLLGTMSSQTASCRHQVADREYRLPAALRGASRSSRTNSRCATVMKGTGTFFIGGNWKSNGTKDFVSKLVADLNSKPVPRDVEVVVAPIHIHLPIVLDAIKPPYQVAAQNCWVEQPGAYTGEIAAEALVDLGVPWVILGHSERRSLCGETSELVGRKTARALAAGLKTIACIGETLAEREGGKELLDAKLKDGQRGYDVADKRLEAVLDAQLHGIADAVSKADWNNIVIAYEPVWAIGTGVVATPNQAQEVHEFIRKWLASNVGADVAPGVRILYGGSVNDANCGELAQKEDIDGFLVGGASLKADAFSTIINAKNAPVAAA